MPRTVVTAHLRPEDEPDVLDRKVACVRSRRCWWAAEEGFFPRAHLRSACAGLRARGGGSTDAPGTAGGSARPASTLVHLAVPLVAADKCSHRDRRPGVADSALLPSAALSCTFPQFGGS